MALSMSVQVDDLFDGLGPLPRVVPLMVVASVLSGSDHTEAVTRIST